MSDKAFASNGASASADGRATASGDGRLAGAGRRVKGQAEELADAAKERAKGIAMEQKTAAAQQIGCVARGLREAGAGIQKESAFAGRYAIEAADRLERLSGDLEAADLDELVDRSERFARANPALFLGGAVVGGFLLARFFKSSGQRIQDARVAAARP